MEEVILDELYLCELETAEHGLRLGLGMATKKGPLNKDNQPTWTVAWFKVKSKNSWKTKNIAFEEYHVPNHTIGLEHSFKQLLTKRHVYLRGFYRHSASWTDRNMCRCRRRLRERASVAGASGVGAT